MTSPYTLLKYHINCWVGKAILSTPKNAFYYIMCFPKLLVGFLGTHWCMGDEEDIDDDIVFPYHVKVAAMIIVFTENNQ